MIFRQWLVLASQYALVFAAMFSVRLLIESNFSQIHGNGLVLTPHGRLFRLCLDRFNATELIYDSNQHRIYPGWNSEWKYNWALPYQYVGPTSRVWKYVSDNSGYIGLGKAGITSHYYACPFGNTDPVETEEDQADLRFILVARQSPPRHRKCYSVLVRMTKNRLHDKLVESSAPEFNFRKERV